jgi:hypothetical protein
LCHEEPCDDNVISCKNIIQEYFIYKFKFIDDDNLNLYLLSRVLFIFAELLNHNILLPTEKIIKVTGVLTDVGVITPIVG